LTLWVGVQVQVSGDSLASENVLDCAVVLARAVRLESLGPLGTRGIIKKGLAPGEVPDPLRIVPSSFQEMYKAVVEVVDLQLKTAPQT